VFADRARNRTRYQATVENQVMAGLVPWREVITPPSGCDQRPLPAG
jgi:hypothetical protein